MAGPPDQKKVVALQVANAKAKWLSNQDPAHQASSSAPDQLRPSTPASSVTISLTNAIAGNSDRTEPTSSILAAEGRLFALDDLSAATKEFLLASRKDYSPYTLLRTLKLSKAVESFGADKSMSGPEGREVLRPETYFFECARKAGMPGGVFRWLQGEPMGVILEYPSSHIDKVIEDLTAQEGLEFTRTKAEPWDC